MTIPTISTLPTAPARTDPPATFVTRADSFLAALVTMQSELNTSIGAMNTDIAGVNDNVTLASEWATKNDAAVSGTDWSAFANASGASPTGSAKAWATTASGVVVADGEYSAKSYASDSSDSAVAAAASAAAAEAASSATLWVSGTSYTAGDVVYSPINYLSYRANTATSGATDPSLSSDWTALVDASPKTQAVASGALANGDLVVINADGTVSVVGDVAVSIPLIGTSEVFENAAVGVTSTVYDSVNNKIVVLYRDGSNSNYGTAIVGTVSGNTISFGTPVVYESALIYSLYATYDSANEKIVAVYADSGNSFYGTAIVGTVSGTSISFGTAVVFQAAYTSELAVSYDSVNSKVVVSYRDSSNLNYGTAIVGTVSGTSISFGTEVVLSSSAASDIFSTYDSLNQKIVITYRDNSNSSYGTAIVGTVSGTSITFGSPVVFLNAFISHSTITFDSTNNKVVIAYRDGGNSNYGTAIVGTVNGTSISFGSSVVFETGAASEIFASYDSTNNAVLIAYADAGDSAISKIVTGTVSGTSISFGNIVSLGTASIEISSAFDSSTGKVVISHRDNGNSGFGTSIVASTVTLVANLTAENYIGVSDAAYTDGATANIQVTGAVDDAQSGLTAGEAYYVQLDGTLSTTPDNPSVFAGTALSATELLIGKSDATSPSVSVTASGSLANGDLVVVNADGTVSVVAETVTPFSAGAASVFESGVTASTSSTFDSSSNKVIISYIDGANSNYGTAVVGTVSGESISFGTPVVFYSGSHTSSAITFDSNSNKVVIAYGKGTPQIGEAIVGTVSGDSISFGTTAQFASSSTNYSSIVFDSNSNKVVIAYQDVGNSNYGTAVVGTVSGTSISFGSETVFEAADSSRISTTFDSNLNKVVIAYQDVGNSNYGTAIVGTVSGTSISFGTAVVFESADAREISATFDSNSNKIVIAYRDVGNSSYGTAIVGTVSGTSISFGSAVVFESANSYLMAATFDSNSNKIVIAYSDIGNSYYATVVFGSVNGTSITFDTPEVVKTSSIDKISITFDSNSNKSVISFRDYGNSSFGTSVVFNTKFSSSNLTAENYIGVSNGAYSDAATANVQITGSVNNAQSGLTAGQAYYVQLDGTLATTPDTTSVFAGTALSATELLIGKSPAVSLGELGVTATAAELNLLDGVTATAAELNYTSGVTSAIQTQIDNISSGFTILSSVDVTSATTAEFIGIPSGVSVVFLTLQDTGDNSATHITVTLGTSSAYKTSGYKSHAMKYRAGTWAQNDLGSAFTLGSDLNSLSSARNGLIILAKTSSNYWSLSSNITDYDFGEFHICAGGVNLGAELTKLKVVNLQGNFETGKIGISYL